MKAYIGSKPTLVYIIPLILPDSSHNHKKPENSYSNKKLTSEKKIFFSTTFYLISIVIDFFLAKEKCYVKILDI